MSNFSPIARTNDLVVQNVFDEILVFDLETNKAHSLNPTAAFVWSVSDGHHTLEEIANLVSKKLGHPAAKEVVWLATDTLKKNNLLKNSDEIKIDFGGLTRRDLIRKIGLGSMIALPIISSIIAPLSIAAQSGTTCGISCSNSTPCTNGCLSCIGLCGNNPVDPCNNVGGSCVATGTCVPGPPGFLVCNLNGAICGPGRPPCQAPRTCVSGTCQ